MVPAVGTTFAVDPDNNRLYASQANLVEVVDLKVGKVVGQITQVHGVHGVALAPEFGKGFITTAIDPKTNEVIKSVPLGGKPEACAVDGTGKSYVNNKTGNEIIESDTTKPSELGLVSLAPCESPSGLAIDVKKEAALCLRQQSDGDNG